MIRKFFRVDARAALFGLLLAPFMLTSCSNEVDNPVMPEPKEIVPQVIVDKSGETYVNTGKIVIGLSDDESDDYEAFDDAEADDE